MTALPANRRFGRNDSPGLDPDPVEHLARLALRYARRPTKTLLKASFDIERRWYSRLGADSFHEAWLLTWLPGQSTDWHDHGDSAGAFTVLTGALSEEHIDGRVAGGAGYRPIHQSQTSAQLWTPGLARSFGAHHVHRVANLGDVPAVSVHVYGPALSLMTAYEWTEDRLHAVGVRRIGDDW